MHNTLSGGLLCEPVSIPALSRFLLVVLMNNNYNIETIVQDLQDTYQVTRWDDLL